MPHSTIFPWGHRRGMAGLRAIILIGLVAWALLWEGAVTHAETEGSLTSIPASYDFGRVPRLGGMVQTTFMLRAHGELPLTLRRIWTS